MATKHCRSRDVRSRLTQILSGLSYSILYVAQRVRSRYHCFADDWNRTWVARDRLTGTPPGFLESEAVLSMPAMTMMCAPHVVITRFPVPFFSPPGPATSGNKTRRNHTSTYRSTVSTWRHVRANLPDANVFMHLPSYRPAMFPAYGLITQSNPSTNAVFIGFNTSFDENKSCIRSTMGQVISFAVRSRRCDRKSITRFPNRIGIVYAGENAKKDIYRESPHIGADKVSFADAFALAPEVTNEIKPESPVF